MLLVELTRSNSGGANQSWAFPGRRAEKYREEAKTRKHETIRKRTEAAFVEPMQCKPVTALPANETWTFEIKFGGYRCIVVKHGSAITLFSRNEKVLNKRFPKVVDALASLGSDFVLDGELVAFDPQGRPSFSASALLPVYIYAFDLLNRDGEPLLNLSIERGRELGRLFRAPKPLRVIILQSGADAPIGGSRHGSPTFQRFGRLR